MNRAPPGHLTLVYRHRALPTEGSSLGGRPSWRKRTRWCPVRSRTGLVVLRGVVLWGGMVCCMVDHCWPLRNRCCCLLGCCCMMGSMVASIVVAGTMVLCMMLSVMFPMVAVVAMVASCAIWDCKGSPNN